VIVTLDKSGFDETTKALLKLGGQFARARKSAFRSVGFWLMSEIRNHVEYGGTGWDPFHPLTKKFWHKFGFSGQWFRRTKQKHQTPLFWLGKFSRYRVDEKGEILQVDFGKTKKGEPGRFDPHLIDIVKRAELGETIAVTEKMRFFFAATRGKRPKKQIPGKHFFPLKKETKTLEIPARPIFTPVFKKVQTRIPIYFENKFWGALERYQKQ